MVTCTFDYCRGRPLPTGKHLRDTADGLAAHSIYFCDPDGNLLELMAAD
jgi:hypothetical protein